MQNCRKVYKVYDFGFFSDIEKSFDLSNWDKMGDPEGSFKSILNSTKSSALFLPS